MSDSLALLKRKLAYFEQQEAITADPEQKFQLHERIEELKAKIAVLSQPSLPPVPDDPKIDLAHISDYAPKELVGREKELQILNDAWTAAVAGTKDRPHVLVFDGLGGEGKTSLVARWALDADLETADRVFAWSFYRQGTGDQAGASSDEFLKEALTFFGDPDMAAGPRSAYDKARRLAHLAGSQRALLILDGLEPLQHAPTSHDPGTLKDQGVAALLKSLAQTSRGLCVVTTRYRLPDLDPFPKTVREHSLHRLSAPAAIHLLRNLGVDGPLSEFQALVEEVKGHALTLTLLGGYLRRAHRGDVRKWRQVRFEKVNPTFKNGHAFRTIAAYERWLLEDGGEEGKREVTLLRLLGLFDRPADAGCVGALREAEPKEGTAVADLVGPLRDLDKEDWEYLLTGLESAKLLTVNREKGGEIVSLDAHPLLREYFARELREKHPEAWKQAHGRLFDYLCGSVEHRPDTLKGLQPLYQAISHGCHAERWEEAFRGVLWDRVQRSGEDYSGKKLGAYGSDLGAVACFFDLPWSKVSHGLSPSNQAWILNEAAYCLRALGRSSEAKEPMQTGLEMRAAQEDWENASRAAGNLSELELSRGETGAAVETGIRSMELADRSGDMFERVARRTTLASALHQTGRKGDAQTLFEEAERMQGEQQPEYLLLYSLRGFRYCDLLLAKVEWATWQQTLFSAFTPREELFACCSEVRERAGRTLEWIKTQRWLLDIALDRLTLARVSLYRFLLYGKEEVGLDKALDHAVNELRRAGAQEFLVLGLFTRAWNHALKCRYEEAKRDLDEAWEIAERGPMVLHQIDVLLHRARLFHQQSPYPWEGSAQADLQEARRLIERHGYWRRKEELEDAEAVIS